MPDMATAYANKETWQRLNPLNDKYPNPPKWWNSCERCECHLAEDDEIAIEMSFGLLPNAVYCLSCADKLGVPA